MTQNAIARRWFMCALTDRVNGRLKAVPLNTVLGVFEREDMASRVLVRLAKQAAEAAAKAVAVNLAWREAFAEEYGHDDISDDLVEIIDYGRGNIADLTAEFIDEHSKPGGA